MVEVFEPTSTTNQLLLYNLGMDHIENTALPAVAHLVLCCGLLICGFGTVFTGCCLATVDFSVEIFCHVTVFLVVV
jgi:hypothetical protein